MQHYVIEFPSQ